MATSKVKRTIGGFLTYPTAITLPWTAPEQGFLMIKATWGSGGGSGYSYIRDATSQNTVAYLSTPNANGLSLSTYIPVKKGNTYEIQASDKVNNYIFHFYPFS